MPYLAALIMGAAAAFGQAPLGLWPATLGGIAGLLALLPRHGSARLGLAFGVGYFAVAMSWIVEPFLVEPDIYGWMAPIALIATALIGGLFWAVPVAISTRFSGGRPRVVATVALLIVSEALRSRIFGGLPWAMTGHIWIDTPVAQWAATFGALGLTAFTLTLSAMIALALPPNRAGRMKHATLAALLLAVAWVGGLEQRTRPMPADTSATLRIVQPNIDQARKWDPDYAGEIFDSLLNLSAKSPSADLTIWPETAVSFWLNDAGPALNLMAANGPLLTGIMRYSDEEMFNSLALISPPGQITAVYDKFHLVPFGEFIPASQWLGTFGFGLIPSESGFSSGPGPRILSIPGLPDLQPLICYEAIFSRHLRQIEARPAWLLQVTNDSWFGTLSGPFQHLAQARLRAIESGLPLIRAANTGVSAVIDARGHIRASLALGQQGQITARLPSALRPTLWIRWGDWPVLLLTLTALVVCAIRRRR